MKGRQFKYVSAWKKWTPNILHAVAQQIGSGFPVNEKPFRKAGDRKSYSFRIEIKNGNVVNNIKGSAVARDLVHLLLEPAENKAIFGRTHVVITFGKNFYLQVFPYKMLKDINAGLIQ